MAEIFIDNVIVDGKDKGELYIITEEDQYSLGVYTGKKGPKGKRLFANKGYFVSMAQAYKKAQRMEIHYSTVSTLTEVIKLIEQQNAKIDALITV